MIFLYSVAAAADINGWGKGTDWDRRGMGDAAALELAVRTEAI